MRFFRNSNVVCVLLVCSFVISLVECASRSGNGDNKRQTRGGGTGRIRREERRGKKVSLVRRLMKNGKRIREGSVRLMDGSTEHEGILFHVIMEQVYMYISNKYANNT